MINRSWTRRKEGVQANVSFFVHHDELFERIEVERDDPERRIPWDAFDKLARCCVDEDLGLEQRCLAQRNEASRIADEGYETAIAGCRDNIVGKIVDAPIEGIQLGASVEDVLKACPLGGRMRGLHHVFREDARSRWSCRRCWIDTELQSFECAKDWLIGGKVSG